MKEKQVVIVGHVCIDENISEGVEYESAGSPAMFMSAILKSFGELDVSIVSNYGIDFEKYRADRNLYPDYEALDKTLRFHNKTQGGKRSQKVEHWNQDFFPEITANIRSLIETADVLVFAPLVTGLMVEYVSELIDTASKDALKVLLPQGYFRRVNDQDQVEFREFEEADDILPLIDFVIISDQDYPDALNLSEKWARQHEVHMIVTQAEAGAVVYGPQNKTQVATQLVNEADIVDSVGSGDVFSAGFIQKYLETGDIVESVKAANEIARACLFLTPEQIANQEWV